MPGVQWLRVTAFACMAFGISVAGSDPRWARNYGATGSSEDRIRAVVAAGGGSYFVGGYSVPGASDYDFWLVKTLPSGAVDWSYGYGSPVADYMTCLAITSDGGAVMAGYTYGFGTGDGDLDILVVKVDSAGALQWAKTYAGDPNSGVPAGSWGDHDDRARAILQTADGGYALVGETLSFGSAVNKSSPETDGWVMKLNATGTPVWQKTYGDQFWWASGTETFNGVVQDADGNLAVTGFARSYGPGQEQLWVAKIDGSNGNLMWVKVQNDNGTGTSIESTPDKGFIVGGNGWTATAKDDLFLVRLSTSGALVWQKQYGGPAGESGGWVAQTADGGFALAGWTAGFGASGGFDGWALKTDSAGALQWQHPVKGIGADNLVGVASSPDGGLALACQTNSLGMGYDYWLLRVGSDGLIGPGCTMVGSSTGVEATLPHVWHTPDPTVTVTTSTATVTAVTPTRTASTASTTEQCGVHGSYLAYQSQGLVDNGNGDGIADPGETVQLTVVARNAGIFDTVANSGLLSTTAPGITVSANSSAYPDLVVGASGANTTAFTFTVSPTVACGTVLPFTVRFSGQGPLGTPFQNDEVFQVRVGSLGAPATILTEDFTSGIPAAWSIGNGGGGTGTWTTTDTCGRALFATPYAIADTWCYCSESMDEELITPTLDCSTASVVTLRFDNAYTSWGDMADVDVRSSITGDAWQNVASWTSNNTSTQSLDISSRAAGAADVQVRWHFYNASCGYYWGIDNVRVQTVSATCTPKPQPPAEICKSGAATPLRFTDKTTLTWEDKSVSGATTFNIYRGTLANLQAGNYGGCFSSGLTASTGTESSNPAAGSFWFYLVTGKNAVGEGTMGYKTGGQERTNSAPCP